MATGSFLLFHIKFYFNLFTMNQYRYSSCTSLGNSVDTMCSDSTLSLLQRHAYDAAKRGSGSIVEIGAYRGGSTIALAMGVREAGLGLVTSIDPHLSATGVYGGKFSQDDHRLYMDNLERFGVAIWVKHICTNSQTAADDWTLPIDLLWIDGDHRYEEVARDINLWSGFVGDQGMVIFDDVAPGGEVEAAIRDYLPFSHFRLIEQHGNVIVFQKQYQPRTLYLCGGMQSGGSTLVSWCFLQRHDLDGVLDMENALIKQDFSRVKTQSVWLKMTIGAFRLTELVALYEAQGWVVRPLLVQRDLSMVYQSLHDKPYGFDGATGDEPPIFVRMQRYLADFAAAQAKGWPILKYEDLIDNTMDELRRVCVLLNLSWDESMITWPKNEKSIAYMENGNPSFLNSKRRSIDLLTAISTYQTKEEPLNESHEPNFLETMIASINNSPAPSVKPPEESIPKPILLPSVRFLGTRRQILETEFNRMLHKLTIIESEHHRILHHMVFGRLLKFWKRFINSSFPAKD